LQRGLLELSRYPKFTGLAVTVLSSSLDLTGMKFEYKANKSQK